jgi:hypothetical protein
VLVLFLEPAGLPRFLTTMRRKGVNLTEKGVNLKFSIKNIKNEWMSMNKKLYNTDIVHILFYHSTNYLGVL